MGFILLLALSTIAVAGSAAFFSVYGLGQIFSGSFIPVLIMGGSVELGKLVAASFLYRYWKTTPKLLKWYMSLAVLVLMLVTSAGIFGFLTAAYQKDSIGLKQQEERIVLYEEQKDSYEERLRGINKQIEEVPEAYVSKRMELIGTFEDEKVDILQKIDNVNNEILELRGALLSTQAKIGPIIYVAEVLDQSPDNATFWFVLIIIFVFDPLAVSLTLATNIAIKQRKDGITATKLELALPENEPFVSENENELKSQLDELKELLNNSNNKEDISGLSVAIDKLTRELESNSIRSGLGKVARNG